MVGIYGVIKRLSPLIALPLGAFNSIFAPLISDLYARKELSELEEQFKTVAKWAFMTSLPIYLGFIFYSKEILNIFDPVFMTGSLAMIIYCTGQMANSASGSVGLMLMMTGRPHINLVNSVLLLVMNVLLNYFLIPKYGIIGCALAGASCVLAIQILRLGEVWYFLRMHPYRIDFLKPILGCIASVVVLSVIGMTGIDVNQISLLALMFLVLIISYGGFLWLLGLSYEVYVIVERLRDRFRFGGRS